MQLPAFVAFTGVDRIECIDEMRALSSRYPIEWGVLVDDEQSAKPLFPEGHVRNAFLTAGGLRLAAHVCGDEARKIANAPETVSVALVGYQRVQVNHSFSGSSPEQIENTWLYGRKHGVRTMLQCKEEFPSESRLDWLFDVSYGTGVAPKAWPRLPRSGPFCGYSGGINPGNVKDVLNAISAEKDDMYWIDMESGIRTDNWLDLDKCESVCRAVYG